MKNFLKKIILFSAISTLLIGVPEVVHAVTGDLSNGTFDVGEVLDLDDGQEQSYFNDPDNPPIIAFILRMIEFATLIIGTIAMIILIVGGLILVVSQGDQQQIDKGKEAVKYAVIGLVVTFLAYVIVIFIQSLFVTPEQITQ